MTTSSGTSSTGQTKLALFIKPAPDPDFHWLRKDADGTWSHKQGSTNARNTDDSSAVITNPATANISGYSLDSYWFTPSDMTEGSGHASIN
jgi:hypothetical protein